MTDETALKARKMILCVEDEPHLRQDILDELSAAGYEAVGSSDGLHALRLLETRTPELILCDISMPGLDGYGLLDAVRTRRPDLADVPFVFLTALNQRHNIIEGKRAGADDYLVKPIDFDLMLASIESRLTQVSRMNRKKRQDLDALRMALGDSQAGASSEAAGELTRILDMFAFGTVLLDSNGAVVLANRAAGALHRQEDGIVIDMALRCDTPVLSRKLGKMIGEVCAAAQDGTDRMTSLALPRPSGRRDLIVIACALPVSRAGNKLDAQVVVFISDPDRRPSVPDDILSSLFGLTRAEAAVARALADGRRTDEIASTLGVSQTTIAFHVRNLFQKTDTHRQAELIALILTGIATIETGTAPNG